MERLALRSKVKDEKHLEIYEIPGIEGRYWNENISSRLHDPLDYAKTLQLRFYVGNQYLPERRKTYTSQ